MRQKLCYNFKRKKSSLTCCVFLHGFGGDGSVWQFMKAPALKKGFSFLSLDLAGHGLSYRLKKPIRMKIFAQEVIKLLDKLNIKKVYLVGHCFGGMVAQEISLMTKNRVEKLVLICSGFRLPSWTRQFKFFLPIARHISLGPKYKHVDFTKFKGTGDFDLKRLWSDISNVGLNSYINIYESLKNWNNESCLAKINIPALVIGGKQDRVFPKRIQKKLAALLPQANLKFLNTNHIAVVNNPKEVKNLILDFI